MKTTRCFSHSIKRLTGILLAVFLAAGTAFPAYAAGRDLFQTRSGSQTQNVSDPEDAFKIVTLNDYDTGKTLGRSCVPADFTAEFQFLNSLSDSGECSIACPYQVTLSAASSTFTRQFYYRSEMFYMYPPSASSFHEGERYGAAEHALIGYPTMVMLYPYTASEFADNIISKMNPDRAVYYDETVNVTDEEDPFLAQKSREQLEYYNTSNPFSFLFEVECVDADTTYTESSYYVDDPVIPQNMKIITCTSNYYFHAIDKTTGAECMYTITHVPYFYMCAALASEKEEAFAQFDVFVANTRTTDEFTILNRLQSQALYEIVNQGWTLIDERELFENLGEGYGSYYEDQFSDYIFDQNDYTTADGRSFKVPTSYDYVYETDDGQIYVTNTTEQPAGSTRLYAN